DDPVGREIDERLVEEAELVAVERPAEIVLELDTLERDLAHLWLEQDVARARGRLRPDERDLGLTEQVAGRRLARPGHRDPEACVDVPVAVSEAERLAELGQDPIGGPVRLVDATDPVDDDPELVAAEP